MPEVRTVRAELDDLDALVPLFDGYRRFYAETSDPDGARAVREVIERIATDRAEFDPVCGLDYFG